MAIVNNSIPKKGTRLSAGVYRNPTTGQTFRSATGVIPTQKKPAQKQQQGSQDAGALQNEYRSLDGRRDPQSLARRRELVGLIRTARRNQTTPPATTPAPAPAPASPPPGPEQPAFRSVSDFYQGNVAESPIYQQRLKEGQRALNARLASMGLSNSGAAIEKDVGLVGQLTAEETGRMQNLAQLDSTRYDAQRESEASRRERMGQNQIDNTLRVIDMYLRQNPMGEAMQGMNAYNQLNRERATGNAKVLGSDYPIQTGGSGGPAPVYDPGYASQPDYSMNDVYGVGSNRKGAKDFMSMVGDIVNLFR